MKFNFAIIDWFTINDMFVSFRGNDYLFDLSTGGRVFPNSYRLQKILPLSLLLSGIYENDY